MPGPVDPLPDRPAWPVVHVLTVVERVERERGVPLEPASRVDVAANVGHHVHGPRVQLPRPAEEREEALI